MQNRISELRTAKGWTMAQLAARADTEASTINKLEKGKTKLTLEWMARLAQALNVRPEHIIANPDNQIAHVSWVQAGAFAETTDPYIPSDTPTVEVGGVDPDHHIALTVEGDSMNLVADEGTVIVVNLDDRELRPGKDYVFRMNDHATFKRWRDNPPRLEPCSSNPEHETIVPQREIEVVGRVVKAIKSL